MTKNIKCFLCEKKFPENQGSDEHILLKSLGGKLKSKNLLCASCNNKLGHDGDNEVYEQFKSFAGILQTDGNKEIFLADENGKERKLNKDYSPHHIVYFNGKNKSHSLATDNKFSKFVDEKLRKMPNHKLELGEERIIYYPTNMYSTNKKTFTYRPDTFGYKKHMLKVAIEFYLFKEQNPRDITNTINCFKRNIIGDQVIEYESKAPIYEPSENEVSHVIHLNIDSDNEMIYAYIQYYNITSALVILNDNYKGEVSQNFTYAYNILTKTQLKKPQINLNINNFDIREGFAPIQGFIPTVKAENHNKTWLKILRFLAKEHDEKIKAIHLDRPNES